MLTVKQHADPKEYYARAIAFWLQNECENCTPIGIVGRLIEGKSPVKGGGTTVPFLLTIESDGQVVATALQTPPHALIVSRVSEDQADVLVSFLRERGWSGDLNGVLPDLPRVSERLGGYVERRGLRVFELRQVIPPRAVAGAMRQADERDLELMTRWGMAFAQDIGETDPDPQRTAHNFISERRAFIWDDGAPTSMACWAGPTPNGVRINFVYTPPEKRGKGYASNLVASLTQNRLDSGKRFCFLYTDRQNPTSNSVYQKLGYNPLADVAHLVRAQP